MELIAEWIQNHKPNAKFKESNKWEQLNNCLLNSSHYFDTLYRGIKIPAGNLVRVPQIGDIIDYSDWISTWSTKMEECYLYTNWSHPAFLVTSGLLNGILADTIALLSAGKLKVVRIEGNKYICEKYTEIKKNRLKFVIDDTDTTYANLKTYDGRKDAMVDARLKFLQRLQEVPPKE